jgi:hypothetical protein
VAYLAVIVCAGLWPLYRAGRMGVRLDDGGATVRRVWHTEHYGWPEISRLADDACYQRWKVCWALAIVLRSGQVLTVPRRGKSTVRPEKLAAIGQLAARYAVPADLAGKPEPYRGPAGAASSPDGSPSPPDGQADGLARRSLRRRIGVLIGTQLALSAAVLAFAATSAPPATSAGKPAKAARPAEVTWDKVRAGDCLQGELLEFGNGAGLPDTVTSVPCRQPHLGEVVFTGDAWPVTQVYPGFEATMDQADRRCARELTTYEDRKYKTAFTYESEEPDGDDWAGGDRSLLCIAYKPNDLGGAPVSYSIRSRGH